jgi:tRNA pseudouridine65 synthase
MRSLEKRYIALVLRCPPEKGLLDRPLSRRVDGPPMPSYTIFRRLAQSEYASLVEAMPLTGRLHQIRRHFYHAGHAIVGDKKYGYRGENRLYREKFGLSRTALHAWRLAFIHPMSGKKLVCIAPIPDDLSQTWQRMGFDPQIWQKTSISHY